MLRIHKMKVDILELDILQNHGPIFSALYLLLDFDYELVVRVYFRRESKATGRRMKTSSLGNQIVESTMYTGAIYHTI